MDAIRNLWLGVCLYIDDVAPSEEDKTPCCVASHGEWTVSGFKNGRLLLFRENSTPKERLAMYGHRSEIIGITYVIIEERLQVTSVDISGSVCFWGIEKGTCDGRMHLGARISSLCFLRDSLLCCAFQEFGSRIDVIDLKKQARIQSYHVPWIHRIDTVVMDHKEYIGGYSLHDKVSLIDTATSRIIDNASGNVKVKEKSQPMSTCESSKVHHIYHGGILSIGNSGVFVASIKGELVAFRPESTPETSPESNNVDRQTVLIDCRQASHSLWIVGVFNMDRSDISMYRLDTGSLQLSLERRKSIAIPVSRVDVFLMSPFDYEDDDYYMALISLAPNNPCVYLVDQNFNHNSLIFFHIDCSSISVKDVHWKSATEISFGNEFHYDTRTELVYEQRGRYPFSMHRDEPVSKLTSEDTGDCGMAVFQYNNAIHFWVLHVEKLRSCDSMLRSFLSLLINWEVDPSLDTKVQEVLSVQPPQSDHFRILVDFDAKNDMYCVLSEHSLRWMCSDRCTAYQTLGMISMFIFMIASDSLDHHQQAIVSSLVSHYGIVYPEQLIQQEHYVFPCLDIVSQFILSASVGEDIKMASRLLLQVSIERMTNHMRLSRADQWAARLHLTEGRDRYAIIVLGMIGVSHPGDLAPLTAKLVTAGLCSFVARAKPEETVIASELLARGFYVWYPHIANMPQLIRDLLQKQVSFPVGSPVATASLRAIFEIASAQPLVFIETIGKEALKPGLHQVALSTLGSFIKRKPVALLRYLPNVVELVIKTLDPSESDIRKVCLKSSTVVLHQLVKRYPMAAFHQLTQRFALGTSDSVILIYCLRTATKWRILEGHSAPVSAVAFEPDSGEMIVSYSAVESAIRVWKIGASNSLFGSFLGFQGSCANIIKVPALLVNAPTPSDVIHNCAITWDKLTREDGNTQVDLKPITKKVG